MDGSRFSATVPENLFRIIQQCPGGLELRILDGEVFGIFLDQQAGTRQSQRDWVINGPGGLRTIHTQSEGLSINHISGLTRSETLAVGTTESFPQFHRQR